MVRVLVVGLALAGAAEALAADGVRPPEERFERSIRTMQTGTTLLVLGTATALTGAAIAAASLASCEDRTDVTSCTPLARAGVALGGAHVLAGGVVDIAGLAVSFGGATSAWRARRHLPGPNLEWLHWTSLGLVGAGLVTSAIVAVPDAVSTALLTAGIAGHAVDMSILSAIARRPHAVTRLDAPRVWFTGTGLVGTF